MFSSCPASALVEGGEDGFGEFGGFGEAGGQRESANGAGFLVFLPAAAREVATHDALDGEGLGFLDDHAAAGELRGEGLERGRQGIVGAGEEVVRHEAGEAVEPEEGDLREDFAFARDAVGHDDVEGGEAVAGDEQEAVAEVEDFADFAGLDLRDAGQFNLE